MTNLNKSLNNENKNEITNTINSHGTLCSTMSEEVSGGGSGSGSGDGSIHNNDQVVKSNTQIDNKINHNYEISQCLRFQNEKNNLNSTLILVDNDLFQSMSDDPTTTTTTTNETNIIVKEKEKKRIEELESVIRENVEKLTISKSTKIRDGIIE
jgi:hypothetical protein